MIHDAKVEVTCDNDNCRESVFVELDYVYRNWSGASGHYDTNDSKIEETLERDHEWIVRDGKHYCSEYCSEACAAA